LPTPPEGTTGITRVRAHLAAHGVDVLEFDVPTPTSETAAAAVGCAVGQIAKTLLFRVGADHVAVIAAGDARVRQAELKRATGFTGKVKMATADEVVAWTGYAPGGVCPFLLPDDLPRLLDASLKRFATVYPAAGNAHSAVPITYERLRELSRAVEAEVCTVPGR
jgi:prolyl-tRNA editing enzyme YbaK/EbsC (Cys-tRNA(Pro) deacylase)